MEAHRLEQIRRSLAMSPSLPKPVADELVSGLTSIIDERRALNALADDLERVVAELRRLAS